MLFVSAYKMKAFHFPFWPILMWQHKIYFQDEKHVESQHTLQNFCSVDDYKNHEYEELQAPKCIQKSHSYHDSFPWDIMYTTDVLYGFD